MSDVIKCQVITRVSNLPMRGVLNQAAIPWSVARCCFVFLLPSAVSLLVFSSWISSSSSAVNAATDFGDKSAIYAEITRTKLRISVRISIRCDSSATNRNYQSPLSLLTSGLLVFSRSHEHGSRSFASVKNAAHGWLKEFLRLHGWLPKAEVLGNLGSCHPSVDCLFVLLFYVR